jgi:hypothetical protein
MRPRVRRGPHRPRWRPAVKRSRAERRRRARAAGAVASLHGITLQGEGFINFQDGRYFVALWHRDDPGRENVLIALWRDPPGPWHVTVRRRTYRDGKIHDSDDLKQAADIVFPADWPEDLAREAAEAAVESFLSGLSYSSPIDKVELRTDDTHRILEALRRTDFLHIRTQGSA